MAAKGTKRSRRELQKDPSEQTIQIGVSRYRLSDPYHFFLDAPWGWVLLTLFLIFIVVNSLFALAYMACGDCIENARPGSFLDPFFFSIQTIATIGYGQLVPRTVLANVLVAIEAISGLLGFGIVAGLAYAKFSRPTARVLFSRVAVITHRDGQLSLMFRMGNERGKRIVDAQVHLSMLRDETTLEGEPIRRVYDLDLVRDRNANFQNSWTAVHPITEKSPLYGATPEKLTSTNPQIVVSLTGLDETFSQTVYARHTYTCENIVSGHRFVDVLSVTPDGIPQIDYTRFHDTVPVDTRKYAGTRSAKNV